MASAVKHKFQSAKTQTPDATLVGKNEWNDEHLFNPPSTGALLVGDLAQADTQANWITAPALGQVLISQGAGVKPAWSNALTLGSLTAGRIPFADTAGLIVDDADLGWIKSQDVLKLFGGAAHAAFAKGIVLGQGTPPGASTADSVHAWIQDLSGQPGAASLHIKDEYGSLFKIGSTTTYSQAYFQVTEPIASTSFGFAIGPGNIDFFTDNNVPVQYIQNGQTRIQLAVDGNIGFNATTHGANAQKVMTAGLGSPPTTFPTDQVSWWADDETIAGGGVGLYLAEESGSILRVGGELTVLRGVGAPFKDVVSTGAETSVYGSVPTIKGKTLGTFRTLRIVIVGDLLNNTGGGAGATWKVKYGGTTICSMVLTNHFNSSATRYPWRLEGVLCAIGATGAQAALFRFGYAGGTAGVSGVGVTETSGGGIGGFISEHNSLALDSAADQTFDMTIQPSANNANLSIRVLSLKAYLE